MNFNIGDIIIFSGRLEPHLRIQKFIGNKWSQVGLIINWNGKLAIFEATKVPICKDVERDNFVNGVQVVLLFDKVEAFCGEIAVKSLYPKLSISQILKLMEFVRLQKGKPFNDSKFFMVRGKLHRNLPGNNESFLCSQLVAETYQRIGLLQKPPEGLASGNFSPSDFSSNSNLKLINGFKLGTEQLIKV